jgi:glycosyltransferase involved in cell wall biosynthesis
MRIAYIAPYQGLGLVKSRPSLRNFSLGGRMKIELIAELLQTTSHTIEILSQGEVIERQLKFYPAFREPEPFHADIPSYYSSAFPVRFLSGFWSSHSALRLFKARHRVSPFDAVLIYNLKPPQVACADYAIRRLGLPVILEYEDDHFLGVAESGGSRFTSKFHLSGARRLLSSLSGCVAVSPSLLTQVPERVPKLLLLGVVGDAVLKATEQTRNERRNWVVFSGTHSWAQGLEQLVKAWGVANLPGWELHIAGHGHLTATLHKLAENNPSIVFHGLLNREDNARLLTASRLAVVPYDASQTRGFPFKTIECLAAGLHVITTPLGTLAPEMEAGITYIKDNAPDTISACLKKVIAERRYERTSGEATMRTYGPEAVARLLDTFLGRVMAFGAKNNCQPMQPVAAIR